MSTRKVRKFVTRMVKKRTYGDGVVVGPVTPCHVIEVMQDELPEMGGAGEPDTPSQAVDGVQDGEIPLLWAEQLHAVDLHIPDDVLAHALEPWGREIPALHGQRAGVTNGRG